MPLLLYGKQPISGEIEAFANSPVPFRLLLNSNTVKSDEYSDIYKAYITVFRRPLNPSFKQHFVPFVLVRTSKFQATLHVSKSTQKGLLYKSRPFDVCGLGSTKLSISMAYSGAAMGALPAGGSASSSTTKQVKLDKESELRIEVGNGTPLRLRLLNGNAEIFGTELPPEIWLTFPPRLKFAVSFDYEWYFCFGFSRKENAQYLIGGNEMMALHVDLVVTLILGFHWGSICVLIYLIVI